VELPKFQKSLEELEDIKGKWIYFVKNAGNMTMIPKKLEEPEELREAFELANQMSWAKEELDAYEAKGIYIQDERGRVEYALEVGLQQGEKIGLEKGKLEEKRAIARAMIKEGMKPEIISRLTGFTSHC
jgi:predicted transposase/invertase (TIGR01784 family)